MTTTRFFGGPWPCPKCGVESDHATGKDGTTPKNGDIGMCIKCAAFYTFMFRGEQLIGLTLLTDDEISALDPGVRDTLLLAQRMMGERRLRNG